MDASIKELSQHIRRNGFDYYQELATDTGYIYRQEDNGKIVAYEVFKRKVNSQYNCISFPKDNAFGTWAWSCRTFEEAKNKMNLWLRAQ